MLLLTAPPFKILPTVGKTFDRAGRTWGKAPAVCTTVGRFEVLLSSGCASGRNGTFTVVVAGARLIVVMFVVGLGYAAATMRPPLSLTVVPLFGAA